ncbi:MAG TPA: selenocysteine-specific translation elongation factor [Desulfobacteraceae bacterium]|nr:selenocysteine-specific translation elongation factor [Desulfobacteraceae bacterium]HPJ68365.1 selenocysteine-specific translation elongation factor [Desulfobacteraceae bacterium]HPQ28973.1 selenocysteine-specific translation elongation factor [Desulfobacteraceae bacterium]
MKQIVLGTAGHIDHGKTSLIKALTGIDTDRLKEEKERGITIELGFAHLDLPGGKTLSIIDVPGHEKFIKNMVAGATGIDLVAVVIAADEGVMPQTREHLEICKLLDVHHGLVVLTKIDMADPDWLDLVKEDVTEYLSGTFLADAPILEVSSVTGQGLKELIQVLDRLIQEIPERDPGHIFRLPVDRVFTMKGFGTVITGTTVSGRISVGDEATIYPQVISSRVRGIQIHNQDVTEVRAGLRTAVNLQGLERAMIQRGNTLAAKNSLRPTYMTDVVLELLSSSPRKLKNRAKVRFHSGTSEIIATAVLLDRDELDKGQTCYAQIRLEEPTALLKGDHYVLRSYSPVRTIGGGVILNALPNKKKRFSKNALSEMETLHKGELNEIIEVFASIGRFQGVDHIELPFLANTNRKRIDEALKGLQAKKRIVQYDKERGALIHTDFLKKARDEILDTITRYHNDFPLKAGLIKEELRSRTTGASNQKLFNFIINQLTQEDVIVQEKELVRLKEHRVTLAEDQEKMRKKLEDIYRKGWLQPPYFKEVNSEFPGNSGQEVLEVMVKEGVLMKIKEDLYFHSEAIEDLKKSLIDFLNTNGEITTPQFKDITGVSRKYTIPLIEHFDRLQLTVRVGDTRILRKK